MEEQKEIMRVKKEIPTHLSYPTNFATLVRGEL